jgi:anti-sigma factor RsiW
MPACATYAPRLPLLARGLLDAAEAKEVRAHLATCAYCQAQAALDDALDAAMRHRYQVAGDEDRFLFTTEEITQMRERVPEGKSDGQPAATAVQRPLARRSRLRVALMPVAAAVLLACLVGAAVFSSHSPGRGSRSTTGQGHQPVPTVGSSIADLTQLGVRIDSDLDQIAADQQAAATDNSQQDQVQP